LAPPSDSSGGVKSPAGGAYTAASRVRVEKICIFGDKFLYFIFAAPM